MAQSTVESLSEVVVDSTEEAPIRVLHVDDEAGLLKAAKQLLEMQGAFEVETALSVEEAMGKMKEKTFDVIVSDYVMPEKDGLQFLKELRDSGNGIPFIIFTGKGREEVAIKALNLGADRYFNKVGDPETVYGELAHGIRRAVEGKRASMEVWRREERLRAVLASSPDAITVIDLNGNIVECNQATLDLYGWSSKDKIIGKSGYEFVAKKDQQRAIEDLKKTLEQGSVRNIECTCLTKDGCEFLAELSASVIRDSSGNPIGFVTIAKDITERKRAEEALRESEEIFRNLAEQSPNMIFINKKGRVVYANKKCEEIMGYKREDFYSPDFDFFTLIAPESIDLIKSSFGKHLKAEEVFPYEYTLVTKDGKRIEVIIATKLIGYEEEKAILGIVTDITERKKAEEERNKLLHDYGERIKELRCLYRMSKLVDKSGISLEEIFQGTTDLLPPACQYPDIACARIVFEGREFKTKTFKETRWKQQSDIKVYGKRVGTVEVYYLEEKPTFDEGSFLKEERNLIEAVAERLGRITERKKAEEALQDAKEKWASLTGNTDDIIMIVDSKGVIHHINRTIPPYTPEETIGKTVYEYVPKEQCDVLRKSLRKVFKTGEPDSYEVSSNIPKIGTLWFRTKAVPIKHDRKIGSVILISTDITERKQMEETLRKSEERFRNIFEGVNDEILYIDKYGKIVDVNKRIEDIFGYKQNEVIGKNFTESGFFKPEDLPIFLKLFEDSVRNDEAIIPLTELELKDKRGNNVPVEASTRLIKKDGEIDGILVIVRDITERKKAEEAVREAQEKLMVTNEKLGVVGKLTRHDARNKLSTVTMNAYLAKQKLSADHKALEHLKEIETACREVKGIFDFAKTYEMLGVEELAYMDVEKSLKETVMLFSDLHGIKVVNDCHGLTVLADSLLRRLLFNLIDNSLRHGEKVSRIRVYYEKIGKDQLKMVYEDDGVGISKTEKEKIFREGYGKGTGYGLYLIRKMCEVYGWTIRETGKSGRGAQFTIIIPKMNESGKITYRLH